MLPGIKTTLLAAAALALRAVTPIGTGTDTVNDKTVSLTTTEAVAAGDSIVALVGTGGSAAIFDPCTDSATNTYTETVESPNNSGRVVIDFSSGVAALALGGTITGNTDVNTNEKAIAAVKLAGTISAVASAAAGASGTSSTPSVTTGASVPVNGVAFGAIQITSGTVTITLPAGWVSLLNVVVGTTTFAFAYKVSDTAGAVTFNPTLSGSTGWSTAIAAYN